METSQEGAEPIPAGEFGEWLQRAIPAVSENLESDVPCGQCNACCRASYFIHVTPQDTQALAAIPAELLFAAPGAPPGYRIMGFDEQGHCPMLVDDRCSIYSSRPSACRSYDCRVFAAANIAAGGEEKAEVNAQVLRWQFRYADATSRLAHDAVKQVAHQVQDGDDLLPAAGLDPKSPSSVARYALEQQVK